MDLPAAALAYAEAGWFVFPLAPGTKHQPVVKFSTESSRDPDQIRKWWTENPDYGIGLHVGRSGLVVFDVDRSSLDELPPDMAEALAQGAHQSSRQGVGDRGHYVFANGGTQFSNKAKAFGPYGEVRGKNGFIVAAPTPHVKASDGGGYRWMSAGPVPELPVYLRALLDYTMQHAPDDEAPALTDAELGAFMEVPEHNQRDRPGRIAGPRNWFREQVEAGVSIHVTILDALCWALREVRAGAYSVVDVMAEFQTDFHEAFTWPSRSASDRDRPGSNEFMAALAWAAAQVKDEDPEALRQRMDRDDPANAVIDEEAFWTARPELTQLRDFARSRRVGPWSMFGCVLARAVAVIPPSVVLPALVGDHAGLNLFTAIVAPSGGGKGSSEAAAKAFLITDPAVHKATPGSGEGLVREYAYKKKSEQIDLRNSVMYSVAEIDSLAALQARSGATLGGELRKAWMSEMLGFGYKAEENRYRLEDHRYRMSMVAGVQPERSHTLFDDADGGTPQRFLWFDTVDPHRRRGARTTSPGPLKLPRWPDGVLVTEADDRQADKTAGDDGETTYSFDALNLRLGSPADPDSLHVLDIPQCVVDVVDAEIDAKLDGKVPAGGKLDSHGTLMRIKVAAVLMWLNGRTDAITEEDWELASVVKSMSDRTRARAIGVLRDRADEANAARGRADGKREVAKAGEVDEVRMQRALDGVRRHAQKAGRISRKALRTRLRAELRDYLDDAVDRLVEAGVIACEEGAQGSYEVVFKEVG
ncbi:bifunctional DNA primase/polymerase [Tsukamurella strandjordii]|uniref:Bifunctional DNA primase/polymerase n=1 Tax=Tsukamurella strandjordii TaxID=147577 RepID=A0AA90SSZ7_9ACTN|nr:bifunctional DNA primase/polymerase [Tsukamurella strandjordii]MDP0400386.1 bifunctional DNA primase/polymerase [Tsukamurella strandjordii]